MGGGRCTAFEMHTTNSCELKEMLHGLPLTIPDAVRLIIEAVEELGSTAADDSRAELIMRLRLLFRKGADSLRREQHTVDFATAATHSLEARRDRRPTTQRDLRHFIRRMLRIEGLATRPLRSLSTEECRHILHEAFGNSAHSYRKGRAILHSIFAHGERQGWCSNNPVHPIQAPIPQEKSIPPLPLEAIRRLEQTARRPEHHSMQFSLILMLYAGVRPTEVQRIQPARDLLWSERQVLIRPSASKTGGGRVVPLRKAGKLKRAACVIPKNWATRWRQLRRDAGFTDWKPDTLRHTFASYHAAYFRNLPELQLEMGHRDAHLLYTRYVMPTKRRDATLFFRTTVT